MTGISNKKLMYVEGHILCEFDQSDHKIDSVIDVKIRDSKYYILLARGSSAGPCKSTALYDKQTHIDTEVSYP